MSARPAPSPAPPRSFRFIWKMAWRDSRASRRRLFLFSLSIVLGVAALVAIGSVGDNLRTAIEYRSLLERSIKLLDSAETVAV